MRKRIWLWINGLLLIALLTGCTLAQPVFTGMAGGDTFCGFWLIYDRQENMDSHEFDIDSETELMLLTYLYTPDDGQEPYYLTKSVGTALGNVSSHLNAKDGGRDIDIKGTIYLQAEDGQSVPEGVTYEIWLYGDVVQSFRENYLAQTADTDDDMYLKPGQSALVYIPENEIEKHGQELIDMAKAAGVHLLFESESPRYLRIVSVMQRPDGTLYADKDNMHHAYINANADYGFTQSVDHTETVNGKQTKNRVTAEISTKLVDALTGMRLIEMNGQNMPAKVVDVTLEQLRTWSKQRTPYQVDKGNAYLIIEEAYETYEGKGYIERTVYSPPVSGEYKDTSHESYLPSDSGLAEGVSLDIAF